jgi:hypothetical protein
MNENLDRRSNEEIINEISELESRLQDLRREIQRRTNDRIEQLQIHLQQLQFRRVQTSSQIAEEEASRNFREQNNHNNIIESDLESSQPDIFEYQEDILLRLVYAELIRTDGTHYRIPIIPSTHLEGRNRERIRGRDTTDGNSSRVLINYGEEIGLVDVRGNQLVSGSIVKLLSRSITQEFRDETHAVVVGTSQHGQRVLLGKISNRNRKTDRVPTNVEGPIPEEL